MIPGVEEHKNTKNLTAPDGSQRMEKTQFTTHLKAIGAILFAVSLLYLALVMNSTKKGYTISTSSSVNAFRVRGAASSGLIDSGSKTMTTTTTCNDIDEHRICQYGAIRPGHKYAVYGSSLFDQPSSINYCFDLPLSAMAWNRIGFDSLVYVVGRYERCDKSSRIRSIMDTLMAQEYVVLLVIEGFRANNSVTVGQVLRLFGYSFVQRVENLSAWQDTYIITADADIWPVNETFFDLPPGKEILHGDISDSPEPDVNNPTNAPLSFVGMRVKTWIEVMSYFGLYAIPTTSKQLLWYFATAYNQASVENVQHGGYGWFMDQAMISERIQKWKLQANGTKRIYIYKRTYNTDRLDRVAWRPESLDGLVDVHL